MLDEFDILNLFADDSNTLVGLPELAMQKSPTDRFSWRYRIANARDADITNDRPSGMRKGEIIIQINGPRNAFDFDFGKYCKPFTERYKRSYMLGSAKVEKCYTVMPVDNEQNRFATIVIEYINM